MSCTQRGNSFDKLPAENLISDDLLQPLLKTEALLESDSIFKEGKKSLF